VAAHKLWPVSDILADLDKGNRIHQAAWQLNCKPVARTNNKFIINLQHSGKQEHHQNSNRRLRLRARAPAAGQRTAC
jgi:hypothetical protein